MILSMPGELTRENLNTLHIDGLIRAIKQDVFEWTYQNVPILVEFDFDAREITIPDDTPQAMIDLLTSVLSIWGEVPAWHEPARQILNLAQSAVGIDIRNLSDSQRWALLAVLMWDRKAIANDLTIRPLSDWVVRKPDAS